MQDKTSIKLTLEQRKLILELMNYSYSIPQEHHACVAKAIKKYATKSYSDETIQKMVQKSQSVANSGFLIHEDNLSFFRGKFAEWLACIEYNSLKNSGSVIMTIVNPDETSKADLLHFIKIGDEFKAIAGPDIKTGGSTYVFQQWKKIVTTRHDIPMVDFDDVLTTDDGLKQLTKRQREEFDQLSNQYSNKKPIPSAWSNQDELRLRTDYFKSILNIEGRFEYTPEVVPLLKKALADQSNKHLKELDWTEFNQKCKEIFNDVDFGSDIIPDSNSAASKSDIKTNLAENTKASNAKSNRKRVDVWSAIKSAKPTIKKVIVGGLAITGTAVGTVYAIKHPESIKKVYETTAKIIHNIKPSGSIANNLAKKASAAAEEASDIVEPIGDLIEEVFMRASPIPHIVKGYDRANGTHVNGYPRGGK